jgi:hypothetical protein
MQMNPEIYLHGQDDKNAPTGGRFSQELKAERFKGLSDAVLFSL